MTRSGRYLILTRGGLLGTPGGPGGIMEHIERNHRIKSNGHKKSLTHQYNQDIKDFFIYRIK